MSSERVGLAVIVVSYNTRENLRACLESLRKYPPTDSNLQVWVVDNASSDGSPDLVAREFQEVRLIRNQENLGFAKANNQAIRLTQSDSILLLNSDAEVTEGALDVALEALGRTGKPIAARLVNPDGSLQYSCFRFPRLSVEFVEAFYLHRLLPRRVQGRILLGGYWVHDRAREIDWALGAFLMVPRDALEIAGLLPEDYPLFGEDMEWCWRLREAGFPVLYFPGAEVIHHGNQSAGLRTPEWRVRMTHEALARYLRAHHSPFMARTIWNVRWLGYAIRAGIFTVLGVPSPVRRRMAREYWRILRALPSQNSATSLYAAGEEGPP